MNPLITPKINLWYCKFVCLDLIACKPPSETLINLSKINNKPTQRVNPGIEEETMPKETFNIYPSL